MRFATIENVAAGWFPVIRCGRKDFLV